LLFFASFITTTFIITIIPKIIAKKIYSILLNNLR
jgi:hypothetical protein